MEENNQNKEPLNKDFKVPKLRFKEFNKPWKMVRLNDLVCNEKYSFTGGPFGSNLKVSDFTKSGVRVIQLNNIEDIYFNDENKVFVSDYKASELSTCNAFPGDIIFAKMMPAGRACILPDIYKRYLLGSDAIRCKLDKHKVDTIFFLESVNRKSFRNLVDSKTAGSTRKRIGLPELKYLPLLIPEKKEQEKIGNLFKLLEEKNILLNSKISTLKKYRKGIIDSWFKNNDKAMKLCKLVNQQTSQLLTNQIKDNNGNYPVYDATGNIYKRIDFYRNSNDSIAIIKYGSGCGRTFITRGKHNILGTMSELIPHNANDLTYIFAFTECNQFKRICKKYIEVGTTPNLYYSDYSNTLVYYPEERTTFIKVIDLITEKHDKLEEERNNLNKIKQQLLKDMFI